LFRAGPENLFTPGQSPADDVIVNSTMLLDMQQLVATRWRSSMLICYEKADWAGLSEITSKCGFPQEQIPECFLAASKRAAAVSS
jgi:hypothetical protein